jgi:hypothetical protein
MRVRIVGSTIGKTKKKVAGGPPSCMTRKCEGRVKKEREREEMLFFRTNLSNNGLNLSRS